MSILVDLIKSESIDLHSLKQKLKCFQKPLPVRRAPFQLYVVVSQESDGICFLYGTSPPAVGPLESVPHVLLFDSADHNDASDLIGIWERTCRLHETPLLIVSLKTLGIEW